jgi:CBS domain-containing protein
MSEQRLFPIVDEEYRVLGVIPGSKLFKLMDDHDGHDTVSLLDAAVTNPVVAYANEPLRTVANRMAEVNLTRLPVVDKEDPRKLIGIISLENLLHARIRNLQEERTKERILRLRLPLNARKTVNS